MSPEGYRIRLARRDELASLPEIERRAGRRFARVAELAGVPEDVTALAELADAHQRGHLWVAVAPDRRLAGFAYGTVVDGNFHLEEVDVVPEHGRRGVGAALVRTVIGRARELGAPAVTLTTFLHVPWNAPFYARLGFRVVPPAELGPGLAAAFRDEGRRGLPVEIRTAMRLELSDEP